MLLTTKWLFEKWHSSFFLHAADSPQVKMSKLKAIVTLVSADNVATSMREFKHYINLPDDAIAEEAVKAIGQWVRTQPSVADTGLRTLMRLLKSSRSEFCVSKTALTLRQPRRTGCSSAQGCDP